MTSLSTPQEMSELAECERIVSRNKTSFVEVGRALARIRDEKLHHTVGFRSFDLYCRERLDIGRAQAYRLIAFVETADELSPVGDKTKGLSERATRPLAAVPKAERREVFEQAQAIADERGHEAPTTRDVEDAIERRAPDSIGGMRCFIDAASLVRQSTAAVRECSKAWRASGGVPGNGAKALAEALAALSDAVTELEETKAEVST